ncbi:MAG: murein biosynthesis integral membrane protein MurJ [Gammaproteobacteria bacterium]|nr:murein biosynthesis integral membrane protein MurJ [Gammaproteobacteria bacterium]
MSHGLLKSTAVVSGMTFLSRILGLIRDIVIARVFGAGTGADAFFVAFRIPNFLRRLFAEGSFSQAFVPVLAEYRVRHGAEEVRELAAAAAGILGGSLLVITALGILAAPLLVLVFAPGFLADAAKYDLTVQMVRLTFPYILFISLTALAGGILHSFGRFAVPAFTPALLNLCLIGATLWLAPRLEEPVTALAWGVLLAGIAQLVFQFPFLRAIRMLPRPRWRRDHPGVRRILGLMLPGIFGSSVGQINLLIDTLVASFLVTGSVSWLYYSERLMEFPLGVFGIALATVILPRLSGQHAADAPDDYARTLDWALRMVIVIGMPAAAALYVLAGPMLAALFQYGEFTTNDVRMAALSLQAYALGLLGFILVKVLAPAFYARQDAVTPVRVGVVAMLANIVMNIVFVAPMVVWNIPAPHAGLALATTLAAFLNAGLLFSRLHRKQWYRPAPGWRRLILQVAAAVSVMTLSLVLISGDDSTWAGQGWHDRVFRLALCTSTGLVVYVLGLWVLGLRWRHIAHPPGPRKDAV